MMASLVSFLAGAEEIRSWRMEETSILFFTSSGQGQHHDVVGWNQGRKGDLVFLDRLQQINRIEAHHVVNKDGSAHQGVGEGVEDGIHVAHGHDQHDLVRGPDAHVDIVQEVLGNVALVGPDHALGPACGAGGVHDGPAVRHRPPGSPVPWARIWRATLHSGYTRQGQARRRDRRRRSWEQGVCP